MWNRIEGEVGALEALRVEPGRGDEVHGVKLVLMVRIARVRSAAKIEMSSRHCFRSQGQAAEVAMPMGGNQGWRWELSPAPRQGPSNERVNLSILAADASPAAALPSLVLAHIR